MSKYSRDQLLEFLRWLALKLGRTPTSAELEKTPVPHVYYWEEFDSLVEAQALAGLEPNRRFQPAPSLPRDFRRKYHYLEEYETPEEVLDATASGRTQYTPSRRPGEY